MSRKTVNQKADTGELDKRQRKIYKLISKHDRFGIFLGAGSGKTRIAIRRTLDLLKLDKRINCLVVSTKANALDTWPVQFREQMQQTGKRYSLFVQHAAYKQAVVPGVSCRYSARIIVVNYEGLADLAWHYENDYFDILLVDESVRVKNHRAKATAIMCAFAEQARYCYPLSGLPTPNNIVDLFTQVYLIDFGKRLGDNITQFRKEYMQQGYGNRNVWRTKGYPSESKMQTTEEAVLSRIADICVTEETETFVDNLTDVNYRQWRFDLSPKQMKQYRRFEKSALLEIEDAPNIAAATRMVLRMKLLQYVSGNMYHDIEEDKPRTIYRTNRRRMRAFDDFLRKHYKPGTKIIVAYGYKHSIPDIVSVLSKYVKRSKIVVVDKPAVVGTITQLWYSGRCDALVGHAKSIGHGLNLQKLGGQVFFYSTMDNYDHFYQLIRRIRRRGNPFPVCDVTLLVANDTADEMVVENIYGKAELGKRVMSSTSIVKALKLLRQRQKEKRKRT